MAKRTVMTSHRYVLLCRYVLLVHHADVFTVACLHRTRPQLSSPFTGDVSCHAALGKSSLWHQSLTHKGTAVLRWSRGCCQKFSSTSLLPKLETFSYFYFTASFIIAASRCRRLRRLFPGVIVDVCTRVFCRQTGRSRVCCWSDDDCSLWTN